jgi:TetR/AcrR family transcriptional regulator
MPRSPEDSRGRIVAAATAEFTERGFAGAGVDRIARRARLNKAMIYYYFESKAALYREILREAFRAAGERVRLVADGPGTAEEKVRSFIAALVAEFETRPYLPVIMLREMAEKGRHLDAETLLRLQALPRTFHAIVAQGVRSGQFRPVDPMLAYFSFAGPLLFFLASAPMREQITRLGGFDLRTASLPELMAHVATGVVHALKTGGTRPALPADAAPQGSSRSSDRARTARGRRGLAARSKTAPRRRP